MHVYQIHGNMRKTYVAAVASYQEARDVLAKIGNVIVFDLDTMIGGADALVISHGSTIADQYSVELFKD